MNEKPKEVMNDNKENETNSPQTEEDEKLPLSFRISLARYKLSNNVEKICKFLEEVAEKGNQKMITRAIEEGLCDKFDPNGLKVIHLAGEKGNLKLVKSLIECGIDKDQLTRYGQTPLVRASAYGQLEVVKYLVSLGAEKHKDALYFAAYEGHLEVVKILVTVGKHRVNESKWGLTPIIAASQRGQLEVVKYLISVGARIQLNDYDEYSAIVWAAGNGHLEVVKYLVSIGGDYNAKEHSGRTALSVAKGKVREYLLSIGAV
ncbi:hypothetical protein TVAG_402920 [Trichomonas vaginalis G3]|uniref:Uncharacterized protein n=1 Tax=Trichomonas vaginalis (strain ATCC PRA-98 / G3) TaxID=412133 RepID=A2G7S6_TRIV3|nr:spectrin binding [Trichomonas vaginalis G3]EAX86793.1 hypothetical protein TVAG_402920 [Trichomonas vaginalis G3]KAI5526494.1 spectrin binding [Trichomonas vaginalis G3]|eukprot:XP_001299723.1 hypothetical protein [Trichomonas vaginalis G3]